MSRVRGADCHERLVDFAAFRVESDEVRGAEDATLQINQAVVDQHCLGHRRVADDYCLDRLVEPDGCCLVRDDPDGLGWNRGWRCGCIDWRILVGFGERRIGGQAEANRSDGKNERVFRGHDRLRIHKGCNPRMLTERL